jgi:DNA-binding NarL/FixJ family response regulator
LHDWSSASRPLDPRPVDSGVSHRPARVLLVNVPVVEPELPMHLRTVGIEIVGSSNRFDEGFESTSAARPDVVILGVDPPAEEEIGRVRLLRLFLPSVTVVAFAQRPNELVALKALDGGCSGILEHAMTAQNLALAVTSAVNGQLSFPLAVVGRFLNKVDERRRGMKLTGREQDVLALLAEGEGTGCISEILSLSPHTVRNHIRGILAKLDVHSRIEAVLKADSFGLIDLGRAAAS